MNLTREQMVRLLRAKAGEYENRFKQRVEYYDPGEEVTYMMADLSLIYSLFADYVEDEIQFG